MHPHYREVSTLITVLLLNTYKQSLATSLTSHVHISQSSLFLLIIKERPSRESEQEGTIIIIEKINYNAHIYNNNSYGLHVHKGQHESVGVYCLLKGQFNVGHVVVLWTKTDELVLFNSQDLNVQLSPGRNWCSPTFNVTPFAKQ